MKYDYYLEKKAIEEAEASNLYSESKERPSDDILSSKEERAAKKAQEAEERRKQREIARLEEEIEKMESRVSEIEEEMQLEKNMTDFSKLTGLSEEMTRLKQKIAENYDKWEALQLEE